MKPILRNFPSISSAWRASRMVVTVVEMALAVANCSFLSASSWTGRRGRHKQSRPLPRVARNSARAGMEAAEGLQRLRAVCRAVVLRSGLLLTCQDTRAEGGCQGEWAAVPRPAKAFPRRSQPRTTTGPVFLYLQAGLRVVTRLSFAQLPPVTSPPVPKAARRCHGCCALLELTLASVFRRVESSRRHACPSTIRSLHHAADPATAAHSSAWQQ